MNLNKLFPRLTISAKLAIAFVLIAAIPMGIVGALGIRSAVVELRAASEAALEHDLDLAFTRTSRSIEEIEQHVTFVGNLAGLDVLSQDEAGDSHRRLIETYLESDPSPIFRFKIIDASGIARLIVDRRFVEGGEPAGAFEPLYQWTASALEPEGRALLPIEVRGPGTSVTPAIAVVVPLHRDGEYLGAVVGEAGAAELFEGLALSAPGLTGGVTALADEQGRFLFHTQHKPEWASLLGERADVGIETDLPEAVAARVMGSSGSERLSDGRLLTYRRISIGTPPVRSLVLYRTLPVAFVDARIRRFLWTLAGVALLLGFTVLAISAVAARQITRPVYALTRAARELTHGGVPDELRVETNDELEDLAEDFNRMAKTLTQHRTSLETLVVDRTKRLTETQAHLGRIVTDAADAIVALSSTGEVTLWNRGAEELFGYTQEEALGKALPELLASKGASGGEPPRSEDVLDRTETAVDFRTTRRAKNGTLIPVTVTKSAIRDEHGRTVGHSLIIRDDRARESLERQMRRSERLAAISVMAGGIAHELNNPLSILGNRIELMQREAIRRDAARGLLEDLEVLRKHVARIGSVTSDLVKFARDESEELGPVDVNSVVERITRLLGKLFRESGVELVVETTDDLPMILGSESVVETLLVNLLLNAQQATPAGGSVSVSTARSDSGGLVRIEVKDTGPGVPQELRSRVFEPFFTTKAARGGTGIGLAVCRALVDRVGGSLELAPNSTGGARFVVALPQCVGLPTEVAS